VPVEEIFGDDIVPYAVIFDDDDIAPDNSNCPDNVIDP
jgi:hypothetical protein